MKAFQKFAQNRSGSSTVASKLLVQLQQASIAKCYITLALTVQPLANKGLLNA